VGRRQHQEGVKQQGRDEFRKGPNDKAGS